LIQAQEMERLLYVALTRAKHTLVLAGAPGLYATSKAAQPSKSQIKWLRCEAGGCNEVAFGSLETAAVADSETVSHQEARARGRAQPLKLAKLPTSQRKPTAEMSNFIERVTPSGLAEGFAVGGAREVETDTRAAFRAGTFDNEATRYGHWWHRLVRSLDWNGNPANWDEAFDAAVATAANQEEAQRDWKLFRAHLTSADDFRRRMAGERFVPHTEFPFLLKLGQSAALEGIIDLILFAPDSRRALILDWKTNRIAPNRVSTLGAKYRSQIAAYWSAVATITGFEVDAALFATAAGKLVTYERAELAEEWTRLVKLPRNELAAVVAPAEER